MSVAHCSHFIKLICFNDVDYDFVLAKYIPFSLSREFILWNPQEVR